MIRAFVPDATFGGWVDGTFDREVVGMANEQNLKPVRSKSEARELGRKGGVASGEARRAQKTLKEYAEFLLSLPVTDRRKLNKLSRMGVPPEGIDNKMLMVSGLLAAACAGDVSAAKEIRNIIGEDKPQDNEVIEKLDEVLIALDRSMGEDGDSDI